MITPELENYIKQSRAQGMPDAQIRQNLLAGGGWSESDLNQAFGGFQSTTPAPMNATPASAATATSRLGLILGIVGVLILAGGGFFGYQYFNKKSSEPEMVFNTPFRETPNTVVPDSTAPENITPPNTSDSASAETSAKIISPDTCLYESLAPYPGAQKVEGSEKGAALAGACGVKYLTSDSPVSVEQYYLALPDGVKIGGFDAMLGAYKSYYQPYNNTNISSPRRAESDYTPFSTLVTIGVDKIAFIQIGTKGTKTEILILEKKKEF